MSEVSRKHPKFHAKVLDLIEKGLNPEEIIQTFAHEEEKKALEAEEGIHEAEEEDFPDEIRVISQALAYRTPLNDDVADLVRLVRLAYEEERTGSEAFLQNSSSFTEESIRNLLSDESYKWVLVESPALMAQDSKDSMLGACCYSTDGASRVNGVVEGNVGSIRLMAVNPRYHGFCVGQRLLEKVEMLMTKADCCKSMCCIPSTRAKMSTWIERRGYIQLRALPYPARALGHSIKESEQGSLQLLQYVKVLAETAVHAEAAEVSTVPKEVPRDFTEDSSESFSPSTTLINSECEREKPAPPKGNKCLPPVWRMLQTSSEVSHMEEELFGID